MHSRSSFHLTINGIKLPVIRISDRYHVLQRRNSMAALNILMNDHFLLRLFSRLV